MTRTPDLTGPCGRAWRLPFRPGAEATGIGSYIVNRPGAHAFWEWWAVSVAKLCDVEGAPPANKHYPEAAYEFLILSLNPEVQLVAGHFESTEYLSFLEPPDAVIQFDGPVDDGALALLDEAIRKILSGEMSPDQDYRSAWRVWVNVMSRQYTVGQPGGGEA